MNDAWGIEGSIDVDPKHFKPRLNREAFVEDQFQVEVEKFLWQCHPAILESMAGHLSMAVAKGTLNKWTEKRWASLWLSVPRSAPYTAAVTAWDTVFRTIPAFELAAGNNWEACSLERLKTLEGDLFLAPLADDKSNDVIRAAVRFLRNTGRHVIRGIRKDKSWMECVPLKYGTTADLISAVFAGELPPIVAISVKAENILASITRTAPLFTGSPPVDIVKLGTDSPPALRLNNRLLNQRGQPKGRSHRTRCIAREPWCRIPHRDNLPLLSRTSSRSCSGCAENYRGTRNPQPSPAAIYSEAPIVKVLLITGAGTSIELGVPGMVGMGAEFLDHVKQWDIEPTLVQTLIGDSLDVEQLIEALDRICGSRTTLELVGPVSVSIDSADKIRAEVEWFVQHVAERVVAGDAHLMWISVLRAASSVDLTLVTTNYDRAIELAANTGKVPIDDGFGPFDPGEIASWAGFRQDGDGHPLLVKLHGSTDWYAAGQFGSLTKLRHPMPLFGRTSLRLVDGTQLNSALVLPSREKLLTRSPYPRLSQTFLNAADCCDLAIIVGSSLRDQHIRDAVGATASRVPLFVVNPSGDTYGLENIRVIKQCASTFLISTLPHALTAGDPAAALAFSHNGGQR